MADMDDITKRVATLNDSLRIFVAAYHELCGQEARVAASVRINDLCQTIVKLGGTITETLP